MPLRTKDVAIRSAGKLAAEYGQDLPLSVEEELERIRQNNLLLSSDESIEVIMLGLTVAQLVVGIAQIAVALYDSFKQKSEPLPPKEELARLVQHKISVEVIKSAGQEQQGSIRKITTVIVEDVLEHGEP